jgi:DNA modification methylase
MKVLNQVITPEYAAYHGDSCEVLKGIPDNSIHYSLQSPPFSSLFTYSDSSRDMGNSVDDMEFFNHFKYLLKELYRVMMPGRLVSMHCMDIPALKFKDGYIGYKDFSGSIIKAMEKVGFIMHGPRVTIWKDPLVQATRTKAIQLAHKQIIKDSAMCATGSPDYIVTFRKPGENTEPIKHPDGFTYYIGTMDEPEDKVNLKDQRKNKYSHKVWQRYASPVWWDINQTDTLNVKMARDKRDERHIAPLQLMTIARCLELWTNKNDTVLSVFAGIGSEIYKAVEMGRKGIGIELKESYFKELCNNMKYLSNKPKQLGLFN